MKARKSDVSTAFSSEAFLNAPDILFEQMSAVFRSWITHGTITPCLLACSFLPLLKSSVKDPADTGSYRAIAGSSLVLKIFEKVILLLWGHLLSSDSLQFGFKGSSSTCSEPEPTLLSLFLTAPKHLTFVSFLFSLRESLPRVFLQ